MAASRAAALCLAAAPFVESLRIDLLGGRTEAALPTQLWNNVAELLPPMVAYVDGDTALHLWPAWGRRKKSGLRAIQEALFLPNGESLVTMYHAGHAAVWNISSRRPVFMESEFEASDSKAFPDGQRIASLVWTSSPTMMHPDVAIWNALSGAILQRIRSDSASAIKAVEVLHPGDQLLTQEEWYGPGRRTGLVFRSAATGKALHRWLARGDVAAVEVSPCGEKVLVAERSGLGSRVSLFLVDCRRAALELELPLRLNGFARLGISRGGARVVAASGAKIYVWDAAAGDVIRAFALTHELDALGVDPDGRHVFTFGHFNDDVVDMRWDVDAGTSAVLKGSRKKAWAWWTAPFETAMRTATVSSGGDVVATCLSVGYTYDFGHAILDAFRLYTQVRVWAVASGRLLHEFEDVSSSVVSRRSCTVALFSVAHLLHDSSV